jgi:transposase
MVNKSEWSANSPDLNPIEKMCKILKDVIQNPNQYG